MIIQGRKDRIERPERVCLACREVLIVQSVMIQVEPIMAERCERCGGVWLSGDRLKTRPGRAEQRSFTERHITRAPAKEYFE